MDVDAEGSAIPSARDIRLRAEMMWSNWRVSWVAEQRKQKQVLAKAIFQCLVLLVRHLVYS